MKKITKLFLLTTMMFYSTSHVLSMKNSQNTSNSSFDPPNALQIINITPIGDLPNSQGDEFLQNIQLFVQQNHLGEDGNPINTKPLQGCTLVQACLYVLQGYSEFKGVNPIKYGDRIPFVNLVYLQLKEMIYFVYNNSISKNDLDYLVSHLEIIKCHISTEEIMYNSLRDISSKFGPEYGLLINRILKTSYNNQVPNDQNVLEIMSSYNENQVEKVMNNFIKFLGLGDDQISDMKIMLSASNTK